MAKTAKIVLLTLLLVSILSLFSFYGCTGAGITQEGSGTTKPAVDLSQQQLQQILSEAVMKYENLKTYRFDVDMEIKADVTGGDESGKMTMLTKMSGAEKTISNKMQAAMEK